MFGRFISFLAALFFLAGLPPLSAPYAQSLSFLADDVTYLWPTDSSRQLSSTFGETRSAHLHAGLDIRTWGVEGYRVFATRDGVVYRIGMNPYGYGNVVYLKHDDGSFSVYAHLNRFEPGLHSFADSIRFSDYSAAIDEIVEDAGITYKQGDVIAYTGSTGAGPPHLHFELRTPEFKPFNPLLTNLKDRVRDTIPPVFSQLGIEYLHPQSLRLQRHEIKNVSRSGSQNSFGEITVNGPVGLSVNVHDRANDTPNVYAVHTLTLVHEADTLFHSQADFFSYRHAQHMFLDRAYPILAQTRRGFQRLYRVSANELPFYHHSKNEGVINLPDGVYPLKIIASDIYGNRSLARVTLRMQGNNFGGREITHVPVYPHSVTASTVPLRQWNQFKIDHSEPMLVSTSGRTHIPFINIESPFRFSSSRNVERVMKPGRRNIISTPDHKTWITFPEEALYDTLRLRMNVNVSGNQVRVDFEPNRIPIHGNAEFMMILPEHLRYNTRLALYSVDQYLDRRFYIRSDNSNGIIRANIREIADLVIAEDNTPPWVGQPRIDRNLAGNYIVIVPARDNQTGVDFSRSQITVNNQRGLVEYEPDKSRLIYYNPDFRPQSSNRVEVTVYDGVGNRTSRSNVVTF